MPDQKQAGATASEDQHAVDVAEMMVRYLESIGIEYVFGIPGGAVEPLYNALARSERRGGLRHILARHETGAAYMADGYARETGKIGVCLATSGPGATNLITGIACAFDNGVPILAITGQPSLPSFGKRALQESACTGINTLGMFRHCTRYNSLVSHRDQAEQKLANALMKARQANGPVHLTFPVDILRAQLKSPERAFDLNKLLYKPSLVDEAALRKLAEAIRGAHRMVFVIGASCGEAIDPILELAELTDSIFLTAPDGKGLVNPRHPLYRGVFGFAGHYTANAALLDDPDLTLAFGTSLGEWASAAWCETVLNDRLIHIDSSEEHLLRSPMAKLHVRGRISTVCERLLEALRSGPSPYVQRDIGASGHIQSQRLREPDKCSDDSVPIKPQRLMRLLSERLPPNVRVFADTGNSTSWAVHYLEVHDRRMRHGNGSPPVAADGQRRHGGPGWLQSTMDFAAMGWAIGAAIGAAAGNRRCPAVCITGDGSYLMNGQEISVAAAEGLNVLFVILNDGGLGMVKHGQRLSGAESIGHAIPLVDYRLQAESFGVPGYVIRSAADLEALDIGALLRRGGPSLLDVRIDPDEVPPMNVRIKTLKGTA
ncbi:thiamine pyrophosphate-binding protein [Chitinimonas koreensis]|uniref:thiamine pyrophosphate-binding protein n=1 Tax=Chitinimonas koreensis TaxID=356302 RepID=UPI0004175090|nr:thiamine pyrophosphate-binding protein [Chitinimonas koreensis]QNM98244.1 thiamine pyrophosphate-binding protein [Chitinimonas koreensis]